MLSRGLRLRGAAVAGGVPSLPEPTAPPSGKPQTGCVKLIHPSPDKVAGLGPVATALQRARTIRCRENDFAVGVCDAHGHVIAGTLFDCYRQVSRFSTEMRKLGYAPVIVDNESQMQGFDVVYVHAGLH